jgi:hypothetical protein
LNVFVRRREMITELVGRGLLKSLTIDKAGNKAMISGTHVGWKEGGWSIGEGVHCRPWG